MTHTCLLLAILSTLVWGVDGAWAPTGAMTGDRRNHAAVLLGSGQVLVCGGYSTDGLTDTSELYDPLTSTWTTTGRMITARLGHTATLLESGLVLVTGGDARECELYDPALGTWSATGAMQVARAGSRAVRLASGRVLVTGGYGVANTCEVYDPVAGTWSNTGPMNTGRYDHTTTLLGTGKVLAAGGNPNISTCEIYNPATGSWSPTGRLTFSRTYHTAVRLASGHVLVAGGANEPTPICELFNPATGRWTASGSTTSVHWLITANLLASGQVLIAGPGSYSAFDCELYEPTTGTWTTTGTMVETTYNHQATLLDSGQVLVSGGGSSTGDGLTSRNSCALYTPLFPPAFTAPASPTNDDTPTWTWVSGGGGNGTFRWRLDDGDLTTGGESGTATSFTPSAPLSAGEHTLYIQEHAGGDAWSRTASCSVVVDLTAPTAPSVSLDNSSPTNDSQPGWRWAPGSGGNGVYRWKLDDPDLSVGSDSGAARGLTPDIALSEGVHTLYVQERDDAGNWSAAGSASIAIDLTPPLAPSVLSLSPTTDTTPVWSWNPGGGGNGTYRWKLDDPDLTAGATQVATIWFEPDGPISGGPHVLYVQERDVAGNWSVSGSAMVELLAPPILTAPAYTSNPKPTWSWAAGGGGNGIYRWKLDDDNLTIGTDQGPETSYTPASSLSEGAHTLHVQESDGSGNWSNRGSASITVDTIRPTVSITPSATTAHQDEIILLTIQFSEAVSGFSISGLSASNATVGDPAPGLDQMSFVFPLRVGAPGESRIAMLAGSADDLAGNANHAAPSVIIVVEPGGHTAGDSEMSGNSTNGCGLGAAGLILLASLALARRKVSAPSVRR